MTPIPLTPKTAALAARLIWFEPAARALADPARFAAYAFARAMHADMKILRAYLDDDDLREALDRAPAGIIDARSWAYWNARLGRAPAAGSAVLEMRVIRRQTTRIALSRWAGERPAPSAGRPAA